MQLGGPSGPARVSITKLHQKCRRIPDETKRRVFDEAGTRTRSLFWSTTSTSIIDLQVTSCNNTIFCPQPTYSRLTIHHTINTSSHYSNFCAHNCASSPAQNPKHLIRSSLPLTLRLRSVRGLLLQSASQSSTSLLPSFFDTPICPAKRSVASDYLDIGLI